MQLIRVVSHDKSGLMLKFYKSLINIENSITSFYSIYTQEEKHSRAGFSLQAAGQIAL